MKRILCLLLLLAPVPGFATGPQLHVVSVDAGEVVEVREAPADDANVIGDLGSGGPAVAVLEPDETGQWAHVSWKGGNGWVQRRHLQPAFADGPRLFRVSGVPPGDVLNVRAEPSAASADIGDVGGDGAVVEVLGADPDAKWGHMVHGEANGWVSLAYLTPIDRETVGESPIPTGLNCGGTEPFWSLMIADDSVRFSDHGADPPSDFTASIRWAATASGHRGFPAGLGTSGESELFLVLRAADCGDGMSDRLYGWAVDVIAGERLLTGCCQTDVSEGDP